MITLRRRALAYKDWMLITYGGPTQPTPFDYKDWMLITKFKSIKQTRKLVHHTKQKVGSLGKPSQLEKKKGKELDSVVR